MILGRRRDTLECSDWAMLLGEGGGVFGGTAGTSTGTATYAEGTHSAIATVIRMGGNGGGGSIHGGGTPSSATGSTLTNVVSGETSDGTLQLSQTAVGGGAPLLGANDGSASSSLTFDDTPVTTGPTTPVEAIGGGHSDTSIGSSNRPVGIDPIAQSVTGIYATRAKTVCASPRGFTSIADQLLKAPCSSPGRGEARVCRRSGEGVRVKPLPFSDLAQIEETAT